VTQQLQPSVKRRTTAVGITEKTEISTYLWLDAMLFPNIRLATLRWSRSNPTLWICAVVFALSALLVTMLFGAFSLMIVAWLAWIE
jgi:hypothetical protein